MLKAKLLSACGGVSDKLYVDDVFSAYTYTGNGATQTINNGIDLAGKGGLVWIKSRSNNVPHLLQDSARSNFGQSLQSQTTDAQFATTYITGVTSAGYSVSGNANLSGQSTVAWTFRKAPKFFDVVTYTGNEANRTIAHSLGQVPGMIIVKPTSSGGSWWVWHRSFANNEYINLNTTAAKAVGGAAYWNNTAPTGSVFSLGTDGSVNENGTSYVAYLFAHDPGADGIVQCGIYTGNSNSSGPTVELGWEPQYVFVKSADYAADWWLWDSSRGLTSNGGNVGTDPSLCFNTVIAEITSSNNQIRPLSTGFQLRGSGSETNLNGYKYIYLAIRRSNKPPTTGTEVYESQLGTGVTSWTLNNITPDFVMSCGRNNSTSGEKYIYSRLQGTEYMVPAYINSAANGSAEWDKMKYFQEGHAALPSTSNHFFRRAPGFMDVVCDTGTGTAHAITHNMTVAPELVIRKGRSGSTQWDCWHAGIANTEKLVLDSTDAKATDITAWNSTSPTAASFTVGTGADVNTNAATYVTYLFATLPGISKVGSYTGNGTTQTINCGFTTGARFILIKRTNSTGDWYVWDTERGVVAGNDPHLSLNTIVAEVTTNDSIDPDASGFIVNQVAATNINVSGGQYIFLAIA